ncbi:g8364 [Coccomyxa viridis]|uniref:G8364 protein n=1 Tax=Coccomyxa viridis TaxID=1274662 RepID=A0ABP1G2T5_9CHLO
MAPVAMHAQLSAGLGGLTALRPRRVACSRRPVSVRAAATGPGSRKPKDLAQQVQQQFDAFFEKYDVLSCGMGALACTSFFVYNGQDPGTALSITLMATISGLALNEVLFEDTDPRW